MEERRYERHTEEYNVDAYRKFKQQLESDLDGETSESGGFLDRAMTVVSMLEAELKRIRGHPIDHVESRKHYRRREDMSPDGMLTVFIDDDGDAYVIVCAKDHESDKFAQMASVEFCTVGCGGGRSQHTREAILRLALAIEKDNEEEPCADPDRRADS